MKKIIWISWEDHRRTRELSSALGSSLIIERYKSIKVLSHFYKAFFTVKDILNERPDTLIVQNPSLFLAFLAAVLKRIIKYRFVVDRHTNFRIGKKLGLNPINIIKKTMSNYSLRHADLTIVTNEFLKRLVEKKGGKGFILPDKLPFIQAYEIKELDGAFNVVFICTYANDEPYDIVFSAANKLSEDIVIYSTGNYLGKVDKKNVAKNVRLTGFLTKDMYEQLLASADIIMDFTSLEWCLVCGGYEAVALNKPFITSNTKALRELYGDSALYANHDIESIKNCIEMALSKKQEMVEKINSFRVEYIKKWNERFEKLKEIIQKL